MTLSFGLILFYLVLGLKLRLFMELSIGSGTFSIMPNLSFGRIVTLQSSPAFGLIHRLFHPAISSAERNPTFYSAEMKKIFETRQASPHDRLEDGSTLLHVSS